MDARFRNARLAAASAGTLYPHWLSNPPAAGPMIKPNPNAEPMMPKPRERLVSSVISADISLGNRDIAASKSIQHSASEQYSDDECIDRL